MVDWAFSQLHLGLLNNWLATAEEEESDSESPVRADPHLTRASYEEALRHLRPTDHLILWLTLNNNLADALLNAQPPDTNRARRLTEAAAAHVGDDDRTSLSARLEWLRARISDHEEQTDAEQGLLHRVHALDLLDRTPDPDMFVRVAGELADAYSRLERWTEAADVYERMIREQRLIYDSQIYTDSRRASLRSSSRTAR